MINVDQHRLNHCLNQDANLTVFPWGSTHPFVTLPECRILLLHYLLVLKLMYITRNRQARPCHYTGVKLSHLGWSSSITPKKGRDYHGNEELIF